MATLTLPTLAGTAGDSVLAPADRFGPYGEPLTTTSTGGADGVKDYTWRAGMGLETLPGSASITIMGARPYHPGLGLFLTPDPLIDGGNALYAYTSGDPINWRDPSGGSEESNFGAVLAAIGGGIAALIAGGAAVGAIRTTNLYLAKAATWISGVAGVAATGAGIVVAVKAGADSDTGLMIAGLAITAVGATAGTMGVLGGIKNTGLLKASRQRAIVDPAPVAAVADVATAAPKPAIANDTGVRTVIIDAGDFAFEETVVVPVRTGNKHLRSAHDEMLGAALHDSSTASIRRWSNMNQGRPTPEKFSGVAGYAKLKKKGMRETSANLRGGFIAFRI